MTDYDNATDAQKKQAAIVLAGMAPLPGGKWLAEGFEHGLDALGVAGRHTDDIPTSAVDDVADTAGGAAHSGSTVGNGYIGGDTSIATRIGDEVAAIPSGGASQTQTLADRVTALNLSQDQAAQVTEAASRTAFGATAGIATLPDGTKMVLPAQLMESIAMQVHLDGTTTVYRGDLSQFLPYLGR